MCPQNNPINMIFCRKQSCLRTMKVSTKSIDHVYPELQENFRQWMQVKKPLRKHVPRAEKPAPINDKPSQGKADQGRCRLFNHPTCGGSKFE